MLASVLIEKMKPRHGGVETTCLAVDNDKHIGMEIWEELLDFLRAMAKPREVFIRPPPIEPVLEPETNDLNAFGFQL